MDTTLTATAGQELRVELESIPASGARWQHLQDASGPQLMREEGQPLGQAAGDATLQVFVFRCGQPGSYTLRFQLRRVWEPLPRQEKTIHVDVR